MIIHNLEDQLFINACLDIYYRNRHGCWKNGKLPKSFLTLRKEYFPEYEEDDFQWILPCETLVKKRAIEIIVEDLIRNFARMVDAELSEDLIDEAYNGLKSHLGDHEDVERSYKLYKFLTE